MGERVNGPTLEGLAQKLEALQRENAERLATLERENAELRDEVAALRGAGARRDKVPELRDSDRRPSRNEERTSKFAVPVSRGALLSKAGAAAVAAVAAGTLFSRPREAAAHHGTFPDVNAEKVNAHEIEVLTDSTDAAVFANNMGSGIGVRGFSANGQGVRGGGVIGVYGAFRRLQERPGFTQSTR